MKQQVKPCSFRPSAELDEWLAEEAARQGVSKSQIVIMALESWRATLLQASGKSIVQALR